MLASRLITIESSGETLGRLDSVVQGSGHSHLKLVILAYWNESVGQGLVPGGITSLYGGAMLSYLSLFIMFWDYMK
jgi:hypothetical protein